MTPPHDGQSEREVIDRALWNCLRPQGDDLDATVTVRSNGVQIEAGDGLVDAYVSTQEDGVDFRVGDLQLVVKNCRVALMQKRGPYPIKEWVILWEGEME